jgi:hypothetical protein
MFGLSLAIASAVSCGDSTSLRDGSLAASGGHRGDSGVGVHAGTGGSSVTGSSGSLVSGSGGVTSDATPVATGGAVVSGSGGVKSDAAPVATGGAVVPGSGGVTSDAAPVATGGAAQLDANRAEFGSIGADAVLLDAHGEPIVIDANLTETSPARDAAHLDNEPLDTPGVDAETALRSGSCDDQMNWRQSIEDDGAQGRGVCVGTTVGSLIDTIRSEHPDLADIERAPSHDGSCASEVNCSGPTDIQVVRYGDGFRIVMARYSDASMLTYRTREYWYFETNTTCHPEYVGHFRFSISSALPCVGSSLWGNPYGGLLVCVDTPAPYAQIACGVDASSGQ